MQTIKLVSSHYCDDNYCHHQCWGSGGCRGESCLMCLRCMTVKSVAN